MTFQQLHQISKTRNFQKITIHNEEAALFGYFNNNYATNTSSYVKWIISDYFICLHSQTLIDEFLILQLSLVRVVCLINLHNSERNLELIFSLKIISKSVNSPTWRIGSSVISCTRRSTIFLFSGYISLLEIESWNRSKFVAFWLKRKEKHWDENKKSFEKTCCATLRD